jgi:hypothetical protein
MTDTFWSGYGNALGAITGVANTRAQRQAGSALAGGDYRGASNALLQNGDLQSGLAVQNAGRERQQADAARQWDFTVKATNALEGVLAQGGDMVAAYDSLAPVFQQMGTTPEQIQALRQSLAANPAQFLQSIKATVPVEYQFRDGGAGDVVRVDPRTGRAEIAYDAPDRPVATEFGIILPPGARGDAVPTPAGTQPMTGPAAISDSPLWQRQIQQESGGRQFDRQGNLITSPKGAFGIAQLMPGTAAELAPRLGVTPEQLRSDPALNERAGQLYMEDQRRKYGGNEALALAAYNAGPGRVDEWIQRFGDPRTGEITTEEFISKIPFAETKAYVGNILAGSGETGGAPVAQGDTGMPQDGTQDLGGGYRLQPMETPADRRAAAQQAVQMARWAVEDSRTARREEREDSRDARTVQGQTFTQENQLRSQFGQNQAVKDMGAVQAQVGIIGNIARRAAAGEQISAQDDLALIFAYMKMLDPGSVVREGEFANAQNTAGVPDRIVNAYNNVIRGNRLNDQQRAEFFQSATGVMNSYRQAYDTQVERTRTLAESYGLDPNRVAPRRPAATEQQGRRRIPFTEAQIAASRAIPGGPRGERGTQTNPINVNQQDERGSLANIPPNAWFFTPQGELLRMPNPNPYRRRR